MGRTAGTLGTLALVLGAVLGFALAAGLHPVAVAAAVLAAWPARAVGQLRRNGLMLLGLPATLGLAATTGGPTERAWGALAAGLAFWAGWAALEDREECGRRGWWPALLPAVWQPTPLGLASVAALAVAAAARWRADVAPARGAARARPRAAWLAVGAAVAVASAASMALPAVGQLAPGSLGYRLPSIALPAGAATAPGSGGPGPGQARGRDGLPGPSPWVVAGLALPALVWLAAAARRSRRRGGPLAPPGSGKTRRVRLDIAMPLAFLTAAVGVYVAIALSAGPGPPLPVPNPDAAGGLLAVLLVAGLLALVWRLWRWVRDREPAPRAWTPRDSPVPAVREPAVPEDRVRAAYARWLRHLESRELARRASETPRELERRVGVQLPELRGPTAVLTVGYERVRYGGRPTELEADRVESALEAWLRPAATGDDEDLGEDRLAPA